jgi:hypothetical protein
LSRRGLACSRERSRERAVGLGGMVARRRDHPDLVLDLTITRSREAPVRPRRCLCSAAKARRRRRGSRSRRRRGSPVRVPSRSVAAAGSAALSRIDPRRGPSRTCCLSRSRTRAAPALMLARACAKRAVEQREVEAAFLRLDTRSQYDGARHRVQVELGEPSSRRLQVGFEFEAVSCRARRRGSGTACPSTTSCTAVPSAQVRDRLGVRGQPATPRSGRARPSSIPKRARQSLPPEPCFRSRASLRRPSIGADMIGSVAVAGDAARVLSPQHVRCRGIAVPRWRRALGPRPGTALSRLPLSRADARLLGKHGRRDVASQALWPYHQHNEHGTADLGRQARIRHLCPTNAPKAERKERVVLRRVSPPRAARHVTRDSLATVDVNESARCELFDPGWGATGSRGLPRALRGAGLFRMAREMGSSTFDTAAGRAPA